MEEEDSSGWNETITKTLFLDVINDGGLKVCKFRHFAEGKEAEYGPPNSKKRKRFRNKVQLWKTSQWEKWNALCVKHSFLSHQIDPPQDCGESGSQASQESESESVSVRSPPAVARPSPARNPVPRRSPGRTRAQQQQQPVQEIEIQQARPQQAPPRINMDNNNTLAQLRLIDETRSNIFAANPDSPESNHGPLIYPLTDVEINGQVHNGYVVEFDDVDLK